MFFTKLLVNEWVMWYNFRHVSVAQLDRASDSDSECRRFDSFRVRQNKTQHKLRVEFFILCTYQLNSNNYYLVDL